MYLFIDVSTDDANSTTPNNEKKDIKDFALWKAAKRTFY